MPSEIIKAYNILDVGETDAEINMYGEVVDARPRDWWTGEEIPGNYIALDEFLHDLDGLKDKANITVHINSVGGDLYGGISIYNRLKALPANITTINDGLAASAGSTDDRQSAISALQSRVESLESQSAAPQIRQSIHRIMRKCLIYENWEQLHCLYVRFRGDAA